MKTNAITELIKRDPYPTIPIVLTPYLETVQLPLIPPGPTAAFEPACIIADPILNADPIVEAPVAILQDHEVENPQPLTPIQEPELQTNEPNVAISPNPSTSLNSQPINIEGESTQDVPYKESEPTLAELPHQKRRKTHSTSEVTAAQQT